MDAHMPNQVDLYDSAYARIEHDLYRQIRTETYGHDLGQTSWVTSEESQSIPRLLNKSLPRDGSERETESESEIAKCRDSNVALAIPSAPW